MTDDGRAAPYEVRVVGAIGPAAREAFRDLAVEVDPTTTVLAADLDQQSLHAMLEQVRALGLELVDVRRLPSEARIGPPEEGDAPRPAALLASGSTTGTGRRARRTQEQTMTPDDDDARRR